MERSTASSAHQHLNHKRPPRTQRAPVPGPYILVGHSIGGSFARIYAGRYRSEVAGLVLVDSANPDQNEPRSCLQESIACPSLFASLPAGVLQSLLVLA